ncbi:arsenate reductase family protein [Alkalicoccus chagannorensis]|uniref:arsenate reductase family protein n=1 Tax=Alkalicoccus chagannorensis TaxID=427072 RepID=UPI0004266DF4|nr:arsenate reductase family protein [Alkalicoccus chagannorensis]
MSVTFYEYPKCSTCRNAKKWMEEHGVSYEAVSIVDHTPTAEEIKQLQETAGLPLKRFFNTSGQQYRQLGLKDRLPDMSEEEQRELLASDGMLIKRPIASDGKIVTLGFKPEQYEEAWT